MAEKKTLGKKPAPKAPKTEKPPEKPGKKPDALPPNTLPFEIDPKAIEASLTTLRERLVVWAKKGRYTKVRFKFRGKQLLPDIPLAAVVAVEGISFYWTGLLRALIVNFAGQTLLDVELVNDSERELADGKAKILSGDLNDALVHFHRARDMDEDNAVVHLNLGIAYKLKGERARATEALERAVELNADGATGAEAKRLLDTLR